MIIAEKLTSQQTSRNRGGLWIWHESTVRNKGLFLGNQDQHSKIPGSSSTKEIVFLELDVDTCCMATGVLVLRGKCFDMTL